MTTQAKRSSLELVSSRLREEWKRLAEEQVVFGRKSARICQCSPQEREEILLHLQLQRERRSLYSTLVYEEEKRDHDYIITPPLMLSCTAMDTKDYWKDVQKDDLCNKKQQRDLNRKQRRDVWLIVGFMAAIFIPSCAVEGLWNIIQGQVVLLILFCLGLVCFVD